MGLIDKMSTRIESLESEIKWMKQRLEEAESNYVNDEEIDFSMLYSQLEDIENDFEEVKDVSEDIKSTIEDLI